MEDAGVIGRLPWKKLGLPDLRDSSGERLWYAVSDNFKNSPRTTCTSPGQPGCLNSDTPGSLTVRNSNGTIVNDGAGTTGAMAVIIAPGSVLTREDGVIQVRDAANANNPVNYLDIGNGEDNTTFANGSTDGFINGVVHGADNVVLVNDRVLAISYEDLMPLLEKRVTSEVANCLKDYAADPLNQGRLPWAADIVASAGGVYSDSASTRFGRLPGTFINTVASSGISPMKNGWTALCNVNLGSWWPNWSELVFYALADAYKPQPIPPLPTCGLCLTVNPPSSVADKRFAVIMAGRRLTGVSGGQPRSTVPNKSVIANYLEDQNATPADDVFSANPSGSTFNDHLLYQ
ncbi:hypothetical protein [Propionivibrio sp.]|uniref:hypothetical protein n=1 Tax=Propionivibrio sp. TaxID=2212460 RepID=UPI0025D4CC7B|nr:hypothetical protein [Propionivibrio sp.]MBK7357421.1 hypothetical protein [Propionivibrio sp.]